MLGGDSQGYTPQSGEFIGHCHDQETAQVHQNAVEAVRKELDKSKQMPAGAHSTDPGGDAEAQMEYPSQIADEREAAARNDRAKQQDVQRNELCEDQ